MMTITALAVCLSAGPPRMLFHTSKDWVLTDATGDVIDRFNTLEGKIPLEAALSADGKLIAFTAIEGHGLPLLFRWDGHSTFRLTSEDGFHGAPVFSSSGAEVAFVHQVGTGSGPVGEHRAGSNSQLYKVRIDGTGLQRLTEGAGCKASPQFKSPTQIVFGHNTCGGDETLELVTNSSKGSAIESLTPPGNYSGEPRFSPDGKAVVFTTHHYRNLRILLAKSKSFQETTEVAEMAGYPTTLGLQWSSDSRFVYYVFDDKLMRYDVKAGSLSRVRDLLTDKDAQ